MNLFIFWQADYWPPNNRLDGGGGHVMALIRTWLGQIEIDRRTELPHRVYFKSPGPIKPWLTAGCRSVPEATQDHSKRVPTINKIISCVNHKLKLANRIYTIYLVVKVVANNLFWLMDYVFNGCTRVFDLACLLSLGKSSNFNWINKLSPTTIDLFLLPATPGDEVEEIGSIWWCGGGRCSV